MPSQVCNLSREERASELEDIAIGISGPISTGSPQDSALNWLINEDGLFLCPDDPKIEQRYVLAVFYYSTEGDDWAACGAPSDLTNENEIMDANEDCTITVTPPPDIFATIPLTSNTDAWLTPVNECEWAGIACNADTLCADRIEFENNNLAGTIPSEVGRLTDLRFLITEQGSTSGRIPDTIGDLQSLIILDLDFNQFTGPIPESLYRLSQLGQIDLNGNDLTGNISPEIGNLSNLRFLQVNENKLTGVIPIELADLERLVVASLSFNDFTGAVPQEVCANRLPNGLLVVLTVDCAGTPPEVECNCCSDCGE